jgi:signal transduction histidine kinase
MNSVSIKRDIYLFLFGLLCIFVVVYSLMVSQSYHVGINESARYEFLYEVSAIEKSYLETGTLPDTSGRTFQVYTDFGQVPSLFKESFNWDQFSNDDIYEQYLRDEGAKTGLYLYAASHRIEQQQVTFYVVSMYDEDIYLNLLERTSPHSMTQFNIAMIVSGLLLLVAFFIVRYLIHRMTKPVLKLAKWSESLDLDDISQLKKLRYTELNILSEQLVDSIRKNNQAIEREAFFLRAASHELRTPVSVISASAELLQRTSDTMPASHQRAVARINRSVKTVQSLITTLLWLSREKNDQLECGDLDLIELTNELINNHAYLIDGTTTRIETSSIEHDCLLRQQPKMLVFIALTNLIRNAFQHADPGLIEIVISSHAIEISNPISGEVATKDTTTSGFGIGLLLVEKICHRQQWIFHCHQKSDHFLSRIEF